MVIGDGKVPSQARFIPSGWLCLDEQNEPKEHCKRCRAEASMKTERQKKGNAGSMESLELRTVRGRDREREKTQKTLYSKTLTQYSVHVCVFNAHVLDKSLEGLTEVLSYFNAH